MRKIKVVSIFGTRPEVIKFAPVIKEIERRHKAFISRVIITGQHREMCKPYLDLFSIVPDYDLAIMQKNQTLNRIVRSILKKLPVLLDDIQPDIVLVQGDTTSAFAASLAAYHSKIKIGHIEAGLRTGNKYNPFPEEINRSLISVLADFHFAPTSRAKETLISEGIPNKKIFITGNTVIDALKLIVKNNYEFKHDIMGSIDFKNKRIISVTTHRRESFGKPLENTLKALKKIVKIFPDVEIVFPVHYNPNVRSLVNEVIANSEHIHIIEPLSYDQFIQLLNKSYLILTDSGGVQEEAPSLGKPVLVLRETTERPEGIEAGTAKLVGTDVKNIIENVKHLMEDGRHYNKMANAVSPYGDGKAALKIVNILERYIPVI
jgi:UDP-N-acetylglucosamine 2-epimerase (non-hydrolysing)